MWRAWLVIAVACGRDSRPIDHTPELSVEHHSTITLQGTRFATMYYREAGEDSPVLVMLHGLGDTGEGFLEGWPVLPLKLQVSFPLAPLPFDQGQGRQWFDWPPGTSPPALADALGAAEARVWPAILELAHGRTLMVGGFSQGAMMAYVMAVRHPEAIACAFPFGGRIPPELVPAKGTRVAPIVAFHGTADQRISIDSARESVAALTAAGADARLQEYAGVGHTITSAMYDDLVRQLRVCLK